MPRRSSGGRSRSSGGFSSSRSSPSPVASKPATPAPPPAPVQSRPVMGGIGSTIAEGMAFGGGSAVAHRAVDSMMGPRTIRHETVPSTAAAEPALSGNGIGGSEACGNQLKAFHDCLNHYGSEISKCQFYMDMLSECRRSSTVGGLNV